MPDAPFRAFEEPPVFAGPQTASDAAGARRDPSNSRTTAEIGKRLRGRRYELQGLPPDGVTEIGEVILHTAVYAGVPKANSAFAIAQEVLAE